MASKRSVHIVTEKDEEDENCARQEVVLSKMRQDVVNLVGIP